MGWQAPLPEEDEKQQNKKRHGCPLLFQTIRHKAPPLQQEVLTGASPCLKHLSGKHLADPQAPRLARSTSPTHITHTPLAEHFPSGRTTTSFTPPESNAQEYTVDYDIQQRAQRKNDEVTCRLLSSQS